MSNKILGFELRWFDTVSSTTQVMFMKYYLADNTLELLHTKMKSAFLARIHYPEVTLSDLYIGNSITIFNRLLTIEAYANSATEKFMAEAEVHFIAVSENCETVGKISQVASSHGLSLGKVRTCVSDYFENGISAQRGDNVSELVGVIVGFNHDKFSADINCIEGTQVHLANAAQTDSIFKSTRSNFQVNPLDDCSLCILKPHVLKDKKAGLAIEAIIEAGFGIESMYAVHMNVNVAEHLLEVYRGIHPSFTKMMEHMVSGPVLGLLVSSKNGNTVEELREFAGPLEPKLAHKLRPKSLRGKLGIDLARNVIQCTDLPEDGGSECDFFFNVLASLN